MIGGLGCVSCTGKYDNINFKLKTPFHKIFPLSRGLAGMGHMGRVSTMIIVLRERLQFKGPPLLPAMLPARFLVQSSESISYSKQTMTIWPRGVVVSALTSHVRGAGFDSRPG